jgi:hypothetical protein
MMDMRCVANGLDVNDQRKAIERMLLEGGCKEFSNVQDVFTAIATSRQSIRIAILDRAAPGNALVTL